jgi:polygalacturonase
VVPRGLWLTGPISLRSSVELHAEAGALVRFSGDTALYPLVETSYEGRPTMRSRSPLEAVGVENVAITGRGVFDGSGEAWRPVKRSKMTEDQWSALVASGGVLDEEGRIWYPSEQALRGSRTPPEALRTRADYEAIRDFLRPVMVSIRESRNVLLDGPTFQNSPAWCIHPLMSENLVIRNLTVRNPWYAQNGDGLDLESVRNAVVYDSSFDVGDDAICLKSGKDEAGRRRGMPTENLLVRRNTVYHGHGGFVVGSEMSGGVRNVDVAELTFIGTDVGIRFKSTRGRGGVVERIHIRAIEMVDIATEPLRFNLFYGGAAPEPGGSAPVEAHPITEETPQFREIHIRDVTCRGAGAAMWVQGLPEMPVRELHVERLRVSAAKGATISSIEGLELVDSEVEVGAAPAIFLHDARRVTLDGVRIAVGTPAGAAVRVEGAATDDVRLTDVTLRGAEELVSTGPEVAADAVAVRR